MICWYEIIPPTDSTERVALLTAYDKFIDDMNAGKTEIRHERDYFLTGAYEGEAKIGFLQRRDAEKEDDSFSRAAHDEVKWVPSMGTGGDIMIHLETVDVPLKGTRGGKQERWLLLIKGTDTDVLRILHNRARKAKTTVLSMAKDEQKVVTKALNLVRDNMDIIAGIIVKEVGLDIAPGQIFMNDIIDNYSGLRGFSLQTHRVMQQEDINSRTPLVVAYRDVYHTQDAVQKPKLPIFMSIHAGYIVIDMTKSKKQVWKNSKLNGFPAAGCVSESDMRDFVDIQRDPALQVESDMVRFRSPLGWNKHLFYFKKYDEGAALWPSLDLDMKPSDVLYYRTLAVAMSTPHEADVDLGLLLEMNESKAETELITVPLSGKVGAALLKYYKHIAVNPKVRAAFNLTESTKEMVKFSVMVENQIDGSVHYVQVYKIVLQVLQVVVKERSRGE
jgi:hypothetical protein